MNSFSYEYTLPVFKSDTYLSRNSFCARCNLIKSYELVNLTADSDSFTMPPATKKNANKTATVSPPHKANVYKNLKSCSLDIDITNHLSNANIKTWEYRHKCNIMLIAKNQVNVLDYVFRTMELKKHMKQRTSIVYATFVPHQIFHCRRKR